MPKTESQLQPTREKGMQNDSDRKEPRQIILTKISWVPTSMNIAPDFMSTTGGFPASSPLVIQHGWRIPIFASVQKLQVAILCPRC